MPTVCVCGGRDFNDQKLFESEMGAFSKNGLKLIHGGASGADALCAKWALANNVPCTAYPADWPKHGKAAGPIRNEQMASAADQVVAFWDGKSKGTKNMIEAARKRKLPVYVVWYTAKSLQ